MDITKIEMPGASFDVIYCSHVLEHVVNDQMAMRELWRVLAPDGWAVFLVPITAPSTIEDWRIRTPEDRERVFGQRDHVRRYGPDFESRLQRAGFKVRRIHARDVVTKAEMESMSIKPREFIFHATK